jgi:hypothetical protein
MSPPPQFPLAEEVGVVALVWGCLAFACMPLQEILWASLICVSRGALVEFSTCVLTFSLMEMVEYWFGAKRDIGSIAQRYWPAGLMAAVFTTLLLWRRDQ